LPAAVPAPKAKTKGGNPSRGGKVEDSFIEVVQAMDQSEQREKAGDLSGALAAMLRVVQMLDAVTARDPEWEPKLVAYRQERAREAIQRLALKTAVPEGKAPAGPATGESAALKKAGEIILPKVDFREATVAEMVNFMRAKAAELDPEKSGVNIILQPGTGAEARITISLANIPLIEALRDTAHLAGLKLRVEANALVIEP
jgi:hypothetical protein